MLYVGSHLVDQILWYMADDPVEVVADIRYRADTRADETTTFQIQFSRGAVAQGMVTQTAHAGLYSNLDIYGRQGRIGLHGVGFTYSIDVVSSALPAYSQPTSIHLPQMEDLRILMHQPQLAEFAQAIRERRQPAITVSDGRRVLKVLDAFIKSERTESACADRVADKAAVGHGVAVTNGRRSAWQRSQMALRPTRQRWPLMSWFASARRKARCPAAASRRASICHG